MFKLVLLLAVLLTGFAPVGEPTLPELYSLRDAVPMLVLDDGGHGSGVAYRRVGDMTYILTAAHVTRDQHHLTVVYMSGGSLISEIGDVLKESEVSDLAVISVRGSHLTLARLAKADRRLDPGDPVAAFGYPLDIFPCLMTVGFVRDDLDPYPGNWLEFSAGCYFGNSGGPLVDFKSGEVVGINVLINTRFGRPMSDRMRAVPIDDIRRFVGDQW